MKGIAAGVLFVVALVVGVFVLTRSADDRGLSKDELAWVHGYGSWWPTELATVSRAYEASTQSTYLRQLRRPFAALARCRDSYRRDVGSAPKRLEGVESFSMRACSRAERAVEELRRDPRLPVPRRTRFVRDAFGFLISADRELTRHLVLDSSPPARDEPTESSRTDTRYSAAVTDVTSFNLDVRCWSPSDWAATQREVAALGPETAKRFFGAAGAFQGTVNLSPGTCDTLDRFAYRGEGAPSRELVAALLRLGRESEQAHGFGEPREAQCDGLQDMRGVARELGASAAAANALASRAWRLYRTRQVDPQLFSLRCRDNGPWDKRAGVLWP